MIITLPVFEGLPLTNFDGKCQECGQLLVGTFVLWQLGNGSQIFLCLVCAEYLGFSLWADALRGQIK